MDFSWKKALWKAVKVGLVGTLSVLVATGDFDKILDLIKAGIHIPIWLAPIVFMVITVIRNYIKQWIASQPSTESYVKK